MTPAEERHDEAATLSRELGDLLIELSIGVHRYAMYPADHPSLGPVAGKIAGRVAACVGDGDRLNLGVARDQLVIEGVATDPDHPVLRDLARRLHAHQLGALTFRRGVRADEVEELLGILARDVDEDDREPVGRLPPERLPGWDHLSLHPLGYGDLEIEDAVDPPDSARDRAAALWLGLAQAAMAVDEPDVPAAAPDSKVVADRIRSHRREEAYDQVIAGYLLQLADELGREEAGAPEVRSRVSNLVRELDEDTLARLLEMGGDAAQRQRFLRDANRGFAADAVVKVLRAAADPAGRPVSGSLTRLLTKLSRYAEKAGGPAGGRADAAVRENVERLLAGWELEDPNPGAYSRLLDRVARDVAPDSGGGRNGDEDAGEGRELDGAYRIVETALEVDACGPAVRRAARRILDGGGLARLLELADGAEGAASAEEILAFVLSPDQLRRILSGRDVDARTLELVVERIGPPAVPPLLDALVESESRAVRRKVFDRLLGMDAVPDREILRRLDDPRWYVVRNLLALIQGLDEPPPGFDPSSYLDHPDPRVRREAFPLALADPDSRDRAAAAGLAAEDERLVRMALLELQDELPEALVPSVVNRVLRAGRPDALRALAARALAGAPSPLAREALMETAAGGRTLLGRRRLAGKSASVLAALEVLAAAWPEHPDVRPLLERARNAGDAEIRAAATGPGSGR